MRLAKGFRFRNTHQSLIEINALPEEFQRIVAEIQGIVSGFQIWFGKVQRLHGFFLPFSTEGVIC
jgi:hypothetical protein